MIEKPLILEDARLVDEARERKRLEEELIIAAQIQKRLLPQESPELANYGVLGFSDPCLKIGGDYYDFILKNRNICVILIADVSGKGISAALLMAHFQATLRALTHRISDMQEMMTNLNELIYKNTPPSKYLSLFYCELDTQQHSLTYINAGHNPPLLVHPSEETALLNGSGPVIGLLPDRAYHKVTIQLQRGDILLLYTDGVTERLNGMGEEFGVERVQTFLRQQLSRPVQEIVGQLKKELGQFSAGAPCSDDITAVILKRIE